MMTGGTPIVGNPEWMNMDKTHQQWFVSFSMSKDLDCPLFQTCPMTWADSIPRVCHHCRSMFVMKRKTVVSLHILDCQIVPESALPESKHPPWWVRKNLCVTSVSLIASNRNPNNWHVVKQPCALWVTKNQIATVNLRMPSSNGHLINRMGLGPSRMRLLLYYWKITNYRLKPSKTSGVWSICWVFSTLTHLHFAWKSRLSAAAEKVACQTRIFLNEGNAFRFVIDKGHDVHLAVSQNGHSKGSTPAW